MYFIIKRIDMGFFDKAKTFMDSATDAMEKKH